MIGIIIDEAGLQAYGFPELDIPRPSVSFET